MRIRFVLRRIQSRSCVCILFACVSDLYVLDAFVFNDAYALHADIFRPILFHSCVRINLFGFISGVCVLDAFVLAAYALHTDGLRRIRSRSYVCEIVLA